MNRPVLSAVVLLMILSFEASGVTPVHLGRVSIDTSIYQQVDRCGFDPDPGEMFFGQSSQSMINNGGMFLQAFRKKNSNEFDFFSLNGKIASSIVPLENKYESVSIRFSRHMLDDDAGWESIVNYISTDDSFYSHPLFKVFDDNGTELLADSGYAYYGFDGNNTYVVRWYNDYSMNYSYYDSWRFRTNIASTIPSLSKTQATSQGLMRIYGQDNGNYQVTLSPLSGNQVKFQMFDLLGRCIFSKQINNIASSQTFTIPESDVPKSPFIAKVSDKNGSFFKKEIPVK